MEDSALYRYHRQMLLPGFGEQGQRKLLDAKVLILGCGALGTVVANTLARSGVGHLVIADRDFVEMTNLQRQVLFDESDVQEAIPKAQAAKHKIRSINSQVKVTAVVDDVNRTNIEQLARGCDAIADGVDNFETRFLANDVAVKHAIPYIYAGCVGTVGMSFPVLPHSELSDTAWEKAGVATPCLRCIFEQPPPPGMNPTCETAGVLGPAVAIVANYEAAEILKILTGSWTAVNRHMLHMDLWNTSLHQFELAHAYDDRGCACCKQRNFDYLEGAMSTSTTTLCGRNSVQILPQRREEGDEPVSFEQLAQNLKPYGSVKSNKFMLRAEITDNGQPYELTVFPDGRAMVRGTTQVSVAKSIYAKYVGN